MRKAPAIQQLQPTSTGFGNSRVIIDLRNAVKSQTCAKCEIGFGTRGLGSKTGQ
jgi:hypothetical protein